MNSFVKWLNLHTYVSHIIMMSPVWSKTMQWPIILCGRLGPMTVVPFSKTNSVASVSEYLEWPKKFFSPLSTEKVWKTIKKSYQIILYLARKKIPSHKCYKICILMCLSVCFSVRPLQKLLRGWELKILFGRISVRWTSIIWKYVGQTHSNIFEKAA